MDTAELVCFCLAVLKLDCLGILDRCICRVMTQLWLKLSVLLLPSDFATATFDTTHS